MAFTLNKFEAVGNLTRDLELRESTNGRKYCFIGIAQNEKDRQGNEMTTFLNATLFGQPAEYACTYAHKGDTVYIEGRITTRTVEDAGKKRTETNLNASRFMIVRSVGSRAGASTGADFGTAPQASAPAADFPDADLQLDISSDDLPF